MPKHCWTDWIDYEEHIICDVPDEDNDEEDDDLIAFRGMECRYGQGVFEDEELICYCV
jgi:hypothetical protein